MPLPNSAPKALVVHMQAGNWRERGKATAPAMWSKHREKWCSYKSPSLSNLPPSVSKSLYWKFPQPFNLQWEFIHNTPPVLTSTKSSPLHLSPFPWTWPLESETNLASGVRMGRVNFPCFCVSFTAITPWCIWTQIIQLAPYTRDVIICQKGAEMANSVQTSSWETGGCIRPVCERTWNPTGGVLNDFTAQISL